MKSSSSVPCARAAFARTSSMAPCATSRPVGDHADMRRQPLDDLEDVRGEEHRAAARDERMEQLLDLPRGDRVDPFERLIEEEQPRRRQQRRGERQLLPHAVREIRDERRRRARADPSATAGRPSAP